MAELWNRAASKPFGVKDCMVDLSKVSKFSQILKMQAVGQMPSGHPLTHPDIDKLITAISNVRAIDIMSSDDALNEKQAQRRFGVRCEIWRLLQGFEQDPFWGRFVAPIIRLQMQELATLFIKIVLKFSQWPGHDLADAIREAKELIPHAKINESTTILVQDLARYRGTGTKTIGIAANITKRIPPVNVAELFVPPSKPDFEKLVGDLYELEEII